MMDIGRCIHCGNTIMRSNKVGSWKHYPTGKEECEPPLVAKPDPGWVISKTV
jgi:hypothetical protein